MSHAFPNAWSEIQRRPGRTVGIVACHALATAALVAIPATVRTTRDAATTTLWDIGAHTMAFRPVTLQGRRPDSIPSLSVVNGMPAELFEEAKADALRTADSVADASPYLLLRLAWDKEGRTFTLGGFDSSRPKAFSATVVAPSQLVAGVFPSPSDPGDLTVEREFAEARGLTVGSTVPLGGRVHTVTGIVAPPLRPGKANAYMDIVRLRALALESFGLDLKGRINALLVESRSAKDHRSALAEIRSALGAEGQITSFGCSLPGTTVMALQGQAAGWVSGCLFAGMLVLILRTQCGAVAERKRELAILRAVGWRTGRLARQFMAATLAQAAMGGLLGSLLGVAIALGGHCCLPWPAEAPSHALWTATGAACLLTLMGGCLAGLASVVSVSRLRPATILRRP